MVDRITFLKSIDQEEREFASTVVTFFDQFMALYSLIGFYDNVRVTNKTNESSVNFDVKLNNRIVQTQLMQLLANNGNQLIIYNKHFNIFANPLGDKAVNITIS